MVLLGRPQGDPGVALTALDDEAERRSQPLQSQRAPQLGVHGVQLLVTVGPDFFTTLQGGDAP
jgi:hypothetical protein